MLWDAIVAGSAIFNQCYPKAWCYDDFFSGRNPNRWVDGDSLDVTEVQRLITFLNQWSTHYRTPPGNLLSALKNVLNEIEPLRKCTILDIDFQARVGTDQTVSELVERVFNMVYECGPRKEYTGASKILHCVHPDFFVMWDSSIATGYGVRRRTPRDYARRFLPRIQSVARQAVRECALVLNCSEKTAISTLTDCGHSVARVMDEFSFCKYTMCKDAVWDIELA